MPNQAKPDKLQAKKLILMRNYINKVKNDPNQLFFDIYNTAVLIFTIGALIAIIQWIASVFGGKIALNPIALTVGGTDIYWYGVIFALAFLFGFLVVIREAKRTGLDIDKAINMVFWTVIFGFIGARLTFALLNLGPYSSNPLAILNIWQGGLSLFGAIVGGGLFLIIYSLVKRENTWKILDLFAPAVLIGTAIGRWGNFFNQEYFGTSSSYLLKMYIHPLRRPWEMRSFAFFHPLFLYESLLCLLLFVVLVLLKRKKNIATGNTFLYYILGYSVIRFFLDFISLEPRIALNLTLAQIVSFVFVVITALILIIKQEKKVIKRKKNK